MAYQDSFSKFIFALQQLRQLPSTENEATCQTHLDAILADGFSADQKKAVKASLLSLNFDHSLSTGTEAPAPPADSESAAFSFGGMWIDPSGAATGFVSESD